MNVLFPAFTPKSVPFADSSLKTGLHRWWKFETKQLSGIGDGYYMRDSVFNTDNSQLGRLVFQGSQNGARPEWVTGGISGYCIDMTVPSGSNGGMSTGHGESPADGLTYACWVNLSVKPKVDNFYGFMTFHNKWGIFYDPGVGGEVGGRGWGFRVWHTNTNTHTSVFQRPVGVNAVFDTGWHRVLAYYDKVGQKIGICYDGVLALEIPQTGDDSLVSGNGQLNFNSYGNYQCKVDDPAIWQRLLTTDEIWRDYQMGLQGRTMQGLLT